MFIPCSISIASFVSGALAQKFVPSVAAYVTFSLAPQLLIGTLGGCFSMIAYEKMTRRKSRKALLDDGRRRKTFTSRGALPPTPPSLPTPDSRPEATKDTTL
jgi:hypothetical protein